ncbi:uncharacterized protein LOC134261736 [Saccostrea cucullata]|uniref:uncharacterized protein LOC134261736 n=1 Tax=Saccostrea cuccullata TaxID=36930 RepID=UPI002ED2CC69
MKTLWILVIFGLYTWMAENTHVLTTESTKEYACDFTIYDRNHDGSILKSEFLQYSIDQGYHAFQSENVFHIMDGNDDGQIEVSEFVASLQKLKEASMLKPCKRMGGFWSWSRNITSSGGVRRVR